MAMFYEGHVTRRRLKCGHIGYLVIRSRSHGVGVGAWYMCFHPGCEHEERV